MKLIMTKGLPASGKSTWAKEQVRKSGGHLKRVNKDDLRDMIDGGVWSIENEENIVRIRDTLIINLLGRGFSVVVDDTNLSPIHEARLKQIAQNFSIDFEVESFLHVPLLVCIQRDLARPNSVGERVINSMFGKLHRTVEKNPIDK